MTVPVPEGDAARDLTVVECDSCGHRSHPYQEYGCERCGAHGDRLRSVQTPGTGNVVAAATVHLKTEGAADAPFTALSVVLDAGPLVRGVRSSVRDDAVGERVGTVDDDGATVFAPLERGQDA